MTRRTRVVLIIGAVLTALFTAINPMAGLGFAMLALLATFPFVAYRWAQELFGSPERKRQAAQAIAGPGILTVRGTMTAAQMAVFEARFREARATG